MGAPKSNVMGTLTGAENPRIAIRAKRELALRGIIKASTFMWIERPVQDHPKAPNPHDPRSKRGWEKAAAAYRRELREMEKTANEINESNEKKTTLRDEKAKDAKSKATT